MSSRLIKRLILWILIVPILLLSSLILVAYFKQDAIVQSQIDSLNHSYKGSISIGDIHLAPFSNFPDISIKIDDVVVYEGKVSESPKILDVADIYVGFNIWDLVAGNYDIHSLIVEEGFFDLVIHPDGLTNLQNALASSEEETDDEPVHIHLQRIELRNLDIHKLNEESNMDIETYIYWAKGGFKTTETEIKAHVDSEFELNVMDNGDTTYLKHKHFEFHTDLILDESNGVITFEPSGITMEHGDFLLEGTVDTRNDMDVDISVTGTKPSFDMFIAFAPEDIIPVLERYENAGKIYFEAKIQGPTTGDNLPFIDAKFGASEAYLENSAVKRRIDNMGFAGHFTNGEKRTLETMEFSLTDMTANLEKGLFIGTINVKNFEEPDIQMELDASFDIPFLVSFLNLTDIKDSRGTVEMHMKFHDVIDLDNPEKALSDLNQAYYAEMKIEDLSLVSDQLPAPLKDFDAHLEMKGKEAQLDKFNMVFGNSDLNITGFLSDLPAVVHHNEIPVRAHLEIKSQMLDIAEITDYSVEDSTGVDEQIENLKMAFSFDALGNAFTEFEHLPKGEFFIDDMYASLKHYPHTLHDFHADVLVDDEDLKIVDFSGEIDDSDFHFNGLIHDYAFWMEDTLNGDVDLDISIRSDLLRFEDLFSYQGENYVPEDYRHEEIEKLELHMESAMHYKENELHSIDLQLDKFEGKMHVHPLRFENFNGRVHYEDDHIVVEDFHGKMGRTKMNVDLNYYLGENEEIKKRDNLFALRSEFIDFDALTNFEEEEKPEPASNAEKTEEDVAEHAEAFNLYELPFTDMKFNVDIGHFIYHRLDLQNIEGQMRTTKDHYIYMDTFALDAAGGHIAMNGYFNGSDPDHIYLKPLIKMNDVDLDKLLFKFENFGQDVIVSDNLHGRLNATITGNIRVYPDFVVDLDQSEIHMDGQVLDGRLENYDYMMMMEDYFGDKDLTNVRFDTLENHMDITNGTINIPTMTIESTLGHMEISGTQDMDDNINYYVRVPWKMVMKAAKNSVFGAKKNDTNEVDEIVQVDPKRKTKYLNLNISGTIDEYKIKLGKDKGK